MADEKEKFRIFKPTYTDRKTGEKREAARHYISFRDHVNARHGWPAYTSERQTRKLAERVMGLVNSRRDGDKLDKKQQDFLTTLPDDIRDNLIKADIIDRQQLLRGHALLSHLEGEADTDGEITTPGYKQSLESKGRTTSHVNLTIGRIKRLIEQCSLNTCADLGRPGMLTSVQVYLGELRKKGDINGQTYNYYLGCLGAFCRWLLKDGRISSNPCAALERVTDTETDKQERRELLKDEMDWLLGITIDLKRVRSGLTAEERERLYRFAYQTGIRPNEIRGLTPSSFALDADPPTVTAKAETVKRRKTHTQVLLPQMADELKDLFSTMMPTARALRMPSKYQLARMLCRDLADAREAWIEAAPNNDDKVKRQQSDFLTEVDHQGARVDFYSLRHSHGSALGGAGVPQSAIQASLHHTTSKTTERYLHTRQHQLAAALTKLPTVGPQREKIALKATGTAGKDVACAPACATAYLPRRAMMIHDGSKPKSESLANPVQSGTSGNSDSRMR